MHPNTAFTTDDRVEYFPDVASPSSTPGTVIGRLGTDNVAVRWDFDPSVHDVVAAGDIHHVTTITVAERVRPGDTITTTSSDLVGTVVRVDTAAGMIRYTMNDHPEYDGEMSFDRLNLSVARGSMVVTIG